MNLGTKKSSAHVGIGIRIIDSTSGEILKAHKARSVAEATGFKIGYTDRDDGWKNGTGSFKKTPLGKATREAMYKAILFVLEESQSIPWTGAVVKVAGSKIYINRGLNSGLQPGAELKVYSKGETLIDPSTGINLGAEEKEIGTLRVTTVKEKFSIGNLQQLPNAQSSKRGDIVRMR